MRGQAWGIVERWRGKPLYLSSGPKCVAESGTKRTDLAGPHLGRDFGWATHAAQRREVVRYLHCRLVRAKESTIRARY